MTIPENIEYLPDTDYRLKTTFWSDFGIAEHFIHPEKGDFHAVEDTFNRAFNEWKGSCEYLTELVMVLNHRCWAWYGNDDRLSGLYCSLFEKADAYACENLKGSDLEYFFRTTD